MVVKHTPGPWEVADNDESEFITVYANGDLIAVADVSLEDVRLSAARANAALIAAAPELLSALEEVECAVRWWIERHGDLNGRWVNLLEIVTAASTKATGAES